MEKCVPYVLYVLQRKGVINMPKLTYTFSLSCSKCGGEPKQKAKGFSCHFMPQRPQASMHVDNVSSQTFLKKCATAPRSTYAKLG